MASSREGGCAPMVLGQGEGAAAAVSGQAGRAAMAVSGHGERAPAAVSGQDERAAPAVCGEGERAATAVSGQGQCAATAVFGQGGRAVAAVSGHDGRAAIAVSGDGEAAVSGKSKQKWQYFDTILEYPCTSRLRRRRLLMFLRENWCEQIYDVVKDKLPVIFDVEDLVKRVKAGQLADACHYAWVFAPIWQCNSHGELLTMFLRYLMSIHSFADGDTDKGDIVVRWFRKLYRRPDVLSSRFPCLTTLAADVLSFRTHQVRNSLDWQLVRNKAAEVVEEIVSMAPDLREKSRYPRAENNLYDLMPIRCSFRPRRQVKKVGKKQATDLAKFYLEMKKRLLPSAQMDCHDYSEVSSRKLGVMLVELFEKVLQAGQRMVPKQDHPPEYLSRGVFTLKAAHVCKAIEGHRPEHSSNQENVFQAVQPMMFNQGHRPEYLSGGVFPFEAVHAYKSIAEHMMIEQGHRSEHASNQAMKRPRFLESHQNTAQEGNALKRLHITGNFVKI